mmetsp:Transcript_24278/g.78337  ORF Transcript_24278/g.78337 Transcript_24278/m.78337 type:complete len:300 (+) Transcript_24278:447-1346(+)
MDRGLINSRFPCSSPGERSPYLRLWHLSCSLAFLAASPSFLMPSHAAFAYAWSRSVDSRSNLMKTPPTVRFLPDSSMSMPPSAWMVSAEWSRRRATSTPRFATTADAITGRDSPSRCRMKSQTTSCGCTRMAPKSNLSLWKAARPDARLRRASAACLSSSREGSSSGSVSSSAQERAPAAASRGCRYCSSAIRPSGRATDAAAASSAGMGSAIDKPKRTLPGKSATVSHGFESEIVPASRGSESAGREIHTLTVNATASGEAMPMRTATSSATGKGLVERPSGISSHGTATSSVLPRTS